MSIDIELQQWVQWQKDDSAELCPLFHDLQIIWDAGTLIVTAVQSVKQRSPIGMKIE